MGFDSKEKEQLAMHVVFTVGTYYPLYSATARCAKNLVDVMSREYDVTVVAQRAWNSPDSTDGLGLAENLRYVSTGIENARAAVGRRMNAREASGIWRVLDCGLAALRYAKKALSRTYCLTSEVKAFLRELDDLNPAPDWLIPHSLPFSGVVACALYKKAHPEVTLTPVIYDQFSESATLAKTAFERRFKWGANLALERMVVEESDRVYTVTWDEHVAKHLPEYADKFEHIEHPLLVRDRYFEEKAGGMFGEGMHAVYAGALNAGVRDPRHLTDLFEGYAEREGAPLRLHAFVAGDGAAAVSEAQARCPNDIELRAVVPRSELLDAYASADVLVSVGNNTAGQKASKVAEYMTTGKPILHIACRDDDPAIPDVASYPLGLVLYVGDGIEANQNRVADFVSRTKGRRVPFEDVAALFPDEVPDTLCDLVMRGGVLIFAGALSNVVTPDYACKLLGQSPCRGMRGRFFTNTSTYAMRLDDCKRADVERLGWIGANELRDEMLAAGQLLSIAEVEGRQMSSKVFGYMATGKPIVHIYSAEDDVNVRHLRRYPLALCLRADALAVADNARKLALWCVWSYGQRVAWPEVLEQFGEMTPGHVAAQIFPSDGLGREEYDVDFERWRQTDGRQH